MKYIPGQRIKSESYGIEGRIVEIGDQGCLIDTENTRSWLPYNEIMPLYKPGDKVVVTATNDELADVGALDLKSGEVREVIDIFLGVLKLGHGRTWVLSKRVKPYQPAVGTEITGVWIDESGDIETEPTPHIAGITPEPRNYPVTPKYKCPLCDETGTKDKIYDHYRDAHGEGLPSKSSAWYWDKLRITK